MDRRLDAGVVDDSGRATIASDKGKSIRSISLSALGQHVLHRHPHTISHPPRDPHRDGRLALESRSRHVRQVSLRLRIFTHPPFAATTSFCAT